MEFLENYSGQSIQELVALRDRYRVDSLVMAIERALQAKPRPNLTEAELAVLAVEAMEREVNNGGFNQFFFNSSSEFAGILVRSLRLIECPVTASIAADALAVLRLPEDADGDTISQTAGAQSDADAELLDACDSRYYDGGESIESKLFEYIERHQDQIHIP